MNACRVPSEGLGPTPEGDTQPQGAPFSQERLHEHDTIAAIRRHPPCVYGPTGTAPGPQSGNPPRCCPASRGRDLNHGGSEDQNTGVANPFPAPRQRMLHPAQPSSDGGGLAISTHQQQEEKRVKELLFAMKELTRRSGEGSEWTRAVRHRSLQAMGRELLDLGFRLQTPANLKPKHVDALVGQWRSAGLAGATVRNRLGHLRWLSQKVGKPGLLPNSNETYGLEPRSAFKGLKARPLDRERLATIADVRVRLALRLQQAFGLRREEAIKFRVAFADRGSYLALKPSWTKGGRYREIPITDPRQRALLDEVRATVGDASLIPDGKTFYEQRKVYENASLQAGLRNNHGLRHWYACWRYRKLFGEAPPALGGRTIDTLSPEERRREYFIRLEISRELGHNRVDVTATYLGPRWAQKAAA